VLFHKAYDKNLIGISPNYEIFISDKLFEQDEKSYTMRDCIMQYHNTKIMLPDRFIPDKDLLDARFQQFLTQ
jgi:putative restriction endonuclease